LKIKKIDDQIEEMLKKADSKLADHGYDNDDDTDGQEVLCARFAADLQIKETVYNASDLLLEAKVRVDSVISDGAAYKYSTDKEFSLEAIVLDGMHQVTPIAGVQFDQTFGGLVFDTGRSPAW
jgi:hypothetical protein